jgi:hypothetical protein
MRVCRDNWINEGRVGESLPRLGRPSNIVSFVPLALPKSEKWFVSECGRPPWIVVGAIRSASTTPSSQKSTSTSLTTSASLVRYVRTCLPCLMTSDNWKIAQSLGGSPARRHVSTSRQYVGSLLRPGDQAVRSCIVGDGGQSRVGVCH